MRKHQNIASIMKKIKKNTEVKKTLTPEDVFSKTEEPAKIEPSNSEQTIEDKEPLTLKEEVPE